MSQTPLIAHIVYALDTGGLENGLVNIINRLPKGGYRHLVICLTSSGKFSERITADSVEIVELNKREGHDYKAYIALCKILRQHRPDIVHSRNLAALEAQFVTLCLPGVKRVHGEHGRDVSDLAGTNWKYNTLRKLSRLLIHHYITVSMDLRSWLMETVGVGSKSVTQIYNGVDQQIFLPRSPDLPSPADLPAEFRADNTFVIGCVGRLAAVKDQACLIDAFAQLQRSHGDLGVNWRLMVVGDGPLRVQLEQQVRDLGLVTQVWFAGDRTDIAPLLRNMDVFVLPSLAEGISNTLLEAMSTGLPVVATCVGGTPEIVEDGIQGYLIPSQQPDRLASAIVDLVTDQESRETMGHNARAKIEQYFSWDSTVKRYAFVYDQLLQQKYPATSQVSDA